MFFINKFFGDSKCSCASPCESNVAHAAVYGTTSLFAVLRFVVAKLSFVYVFIFLLVLLFFVKLGLLTSHGFLGNKYYAPASDPFFYTNSSQELYDSLLLRESLVADSNAYYNYDSSESSAYYFNDSNAVVNTPILAAPTDTYPSFESNLPDGSYTGLVEFYDVIFSFDKSKVSCLLALNVSNSVSVHPVDLSSQSHSSVVYVYGFSDTQCPVFSPKYASFTSVDGKAFLSSFFVF